MPRQAVPSIRQWSGDWPGHGATPVDVNGRSHIWGADADADTAAPAICCIRITGLLPAIRNARHQFAPVDDFRCSPLATIEAEQPMSPMTLLKRSVVICLSRHEALRTSLRLYSALSLACRCPPRRSPLCLHAIKRWSESLSFAYEIQVTDA